MRRVQANLTPMSFSSLVALLEHRAVTQPGDRAFVFLSDRGVREAELTFAQLHDSARALARELVQKAAPGDRALLVFPQGLDFIVALFGCLMAGVIGVPMMVPRRQSSRDSTASITTDCAPRFILASPSLMSGARKDVAARFANGSYEWIAVDAMANDCVGSNSMRLPSVGGETIAFLQYTSGSTSDPKGVVVTHENLLQNLQMIQLSFGVSQASTFVSWIPLYHDMGLILSALEPFYVGACCVLMAPAAFVQRPMVWLKAIQEYRGEISSVPNFAFDLCVSRFSPEAAEGLDLSSWKVAVNASEPVHADTIERFNRTFAPYGFDPRAMCPSYGMAEATVMISGGVCGAGHVTRAVSRSELCNGRVCSPAGQSDSQTVVGCGRAVVGELIAVVDPKNFNRLGADQIGEVWVCGPHVAKGYWRNEVATRETFAAQIDGDPACWLRTGDLAFIDDAGELYITGRIKELLIIRGANHYPQDIERTVQNVDPALRNNGGAIFSVSDEHGDETLVVVQEVERAYRRSIDIADMVGRIREAIANEHEVLARHVVLVRPGALPKTTSGKIQRGVARQLWLENRLDLLTTNVA
jgi:acyl-CoA synthetase (AMP-forming)/AMP-acid ligase II